MSEPTDTSPPVATPCSQTNGVLSEGPCWEVGREELLWVDIVGKQLHRAQLGPDGSLHAPETVSFDRPVAAVAPAADGGYILAAGTGFLFLDASGKVHELAQPESANRGVRMNDGACDPQGRFWAGSMAEDESPGAGALYRLGCDGSCRLVQGHVVVALRRWLLLQPFAVPFGPLVVARSEAQLADKRVEA